jgi:hypothetical protein
MPVYHDISTEEGLRHFLEMRSHQLLKSGKCVVCFQEPENHRTAAQSNSLWLWAEMVAICLNEAGLDMRTVIREDVDIPWTKHGVVDQLWRPVQKAMTGHTSTKKPKKGEYSDIYDTIVRHLGDRFGVTLPDWPTRKL